MDKFRNVNYPYVNQDDTFDAKGLHLNMIVDEINSRDVGTEVPDIAFGDSADLILGLSTDIDAAFIDYRASFPLSSAIGTQLDETGTIVVNNSSEHINKTALTHTRESGNHSQGSLTNVGIDVVLVGLYIVLRITNGTSDNMKFTYTPKIMKYAS